MKRVLPFRLFTPFVAALAAGFFAGPAAAQETQEAPVDLSVSVNHSVDAEAPQGWPLIVTANVMHVDAFAETAEDFVINAVDGSWAKAVRLTLRDAGGTAVALPLSLITEDTGSLTLDEEFAGEITWVASGDAVSALTPGTYTLEAVIEPSALGTPGLEAVESVPATVRVVAAPSGTPAQQQEAMKMRLATYEVAQGELAAALAHLDELIAAQPTLPNAHFFRGQVLEALEEPWDALMAYQDALRNAGGEEGDEPPVFIAQAMNALVREIENATAFEITVEDKPISHPYGEQGYEKAFAIDGISGRELYLERGKEYTFRIAEVPAATPFMLTVSAAGGQGTEPYTDGVTGTTPASGTTEFTFTPSETTPDLLYYGSSTEALMGWRLRIRNGATSTPNEQDDEAGDLPEGFALSPVYPNPFQEEARLTLRVAEAQHVTVEVFDLLGRRVRQLHDGTLQPGDTHAFTLSAAGLASGMYVVRATGETFKAVRAVTVAR